MVTVLEWGLFALLTTLTGLFSAYIVWKVIKPGLKSAINGYIPVIGNMVKKQMGNFMQEQLDNVDIGAIAGQLGGEEGGGVDLGGIAGLLGGQGGGLGDLLSLLGQFSGKKGTNKGGKMGL